MLYSQEDARNTVDFISDTHLEWQSKRFFKSHVNRLLFNKCSDVLFIAGDFCQVDRWDQNNLNYLFKQYKQVYYLFGNHEFYNSNIFKIDDLLEEVSEDYPNVKFIADNYYCEDLDTAFFVNWHPYHSLNKEKIADSHFILDYKKHVDEMRKRDDLFLSKMLAEGVNPQVVVTHYLPFVESISLRYLGSPLTPFFLSDREKPLLALQPKIVIHGHTHDSKSYVKQFEGTDISTSVWCNPIGYPGENTYTGESVKHVFIDRG